VWKSLWITFVNTVKKSKLLLLLRTVSFDTWRNSLFINHYQKNALSRVQKSAAQAFVRACRRYPHIGINKL